MDIPENVADGEIGCSFAEALFSHLLHYMSALSILYI
jgi:hypothetical protein